MPADPALRLLWDFQTQAPGTVITQSQVVVYQAEGQQDNPDSVIMHVAVDHPDNDIEWLYSIIRQFQDGDYYFRVRVQDDQDRWSEWSEEIVGHKQWQPAEPPAGGAVRVSTGSMNGGGCSAGCRN